MDAVTNNPQIVSVAGVIVMLAGIFDIIPDNIAMFVAIALFMIAGFLWSQVGKRKN